MSARRTGPNANETIQGKLRNREQLRERQRVADLKEIMSLAVGRRFVYDLLFEKCGLMNVYLAQDSGIYRNEGRRGLAAEIASEIQEKHPETYVLMLSEAMQARDNERKLREAALTTKDDEEI